MLPSNQNNHDPHIPAKHLCCFVTAAQPLLSMSRKNLLLTLCYGWDIMLIKSWFIFIIKLMLNILDERWKAGLFPPGIWFHLIHLGHEFRVLCFLMSVPNRVWGSMGLPCFTYLASYSFSGGPS